MEDKKGKRPDFTISAETRMLDAMLRECKEGEVLTYEVMSCALGQDVHGIIQRLQSARRRLLSDGIYTATVRGVGVMVCAKKDAIAGARRQRSDRINSCVRQAKRMLNVAALDFDSLSPQEKTAFVLESTLVGAHELLNKEKSAKRLEGAIVVSNAVSGPIPLPGAKALEVVKE